jgi:hypothetical protein
MIRTRWRGDGVANRPGVVSVTHTRIARYRDLPGILRAGAGLLRHWDEHAGGMGVQVGLDVRRRESWTVSLWDSDDALRRFVSSRRHRAVVAAHRACVDVRSRSYPTEAFDPASAWTAASDLGTR